MKNTWPIALAVAGIIVIIFIAFNFPKSQEDTALKEIFPEEDVAKTQEIQYEFVNDEKQTKPSVPNGQAAKVESAKPVSIQTMAQPAVSQVALQPAVNSAAAKSAAKYAIQIASFKEKSKAESTLKAIQAAGKYTAYLATKDLGTQGLWHRIYVGDFTTKDQAEGLLTQVKQDYQNSFIIAH